LAERSNHSGPSSLGKFDICASASNDEARFRQHLQIFTPAHAQNHGTEEIHSARLVKIAVDGTALGAFFTKSHNRKTRAVLVKSLLALSGSRLLAISMWNDADSLALAENLGAAKLLNKMELAETLVPSIFQAVLPHHEDHPKAQRAHG
jgi:hypothetical protein